MTGRLNSFQRTMLHWNDLHPYNAVMVIRISAALDVARLEKAVNATLAAHGLTHLTLNRRAGTFQYGGGGANCEIKTVAAGENPATALAAEIEAQLNTAFVPVAGFHPFRFFAVPEPAEFSLGIVYFHAIADAEAVLLVVRQIAKMFLNGTDAAAFPPLNFEPVRRDGLIGRMFRLAKILAALPAQIAALRSSRRLFCRDAEDFRNRFNFFTPPPETLATLRRTAKAWDVTVNDLLLALLLKSFSRLQPERLNSPRRRNISMGCVVNLRKDFGLNGQRIFCPLLGAFNVTHALPVGISLLALAQDIRRQTRIIKQGRLYLGSPLVQAFGRFVFARFARSRQKSFYQKNYPLWGGLTNVNLNALWPMAPGEKPADGFSAVATGPVAPLVCAITTAGERVNVALTWRPAFFSEPEIGQIKHDFLESLAQLQTVPDETARG